MSLTDELATMRSTGYIADFSAVPGGLWCGSCGRTHDPRRAKVEAVVRFEGASGPEAAVITLLRDARP
ncbi:MAG: hypothetical protein ACSLFB_06850 [Acidimicrobiales bacterium]